MKNTCIVLRNVNSFMSAIDFESVIDAFMKEGFSVGKIFILPFDNVSGLCETITAERGNCDNLIFIADGVLIQSLKGVLGSVADMDFLADYILVTQDCNFLVCPTGSFGVNIASTQLIPYLKRKYGVSNFKLVIRMVGAPMKKIQTAVAKASELSRNTLAFHINENFGDIRLEIVYDTTTPVILIDAVKRIIMGDLNDYIYALEDKSIEYRLFEALKLRRMKISVAESFTGGGVSSRLVSIPGISEVFFEGLNTYSNDSKIRRLGVAKETLFNNGAVSDETAYEMAAGLLKTGSCDLAVSTTGVAGPDADGSGKPVGLCYIAVGVKEEIYVSKFNLSGDREKITKTAINYALFQALKVIS